MPEFEELSKCADELGLLIEIEKLLDDKEDSRLFLNVRNDKKELVATRAIESILDLPQYSADLLNEISK